MSKPTSTRKKVPSAKERKANSRKASAKAFKQTKAKPTAKKAVQVKTDSGEPVYVVKMASGNRFFASGASPKEIKESAAVLLSNQADPTKASRDSVKYVTPYYRR